MLLSVLVGVALAPAPGPGESPVADAPSDAGETSEPAPAEVEPADGDTTPSMPEPPTLPEPPPTSVVDAPEPSSVHWTAPEGCPAADELRHGVERRLGRTLSPGEVDVDARVTEPASGGFRLALTTDVEGVHDERTLDADDCGALADATALIVALAVDPVAVADALGAWQSPAPEDAPPPIVATNEVGPATGTGRSPAARAESPTEPTDGPREPMTGIFRSSAGVGLGAVPGVTGAFALAGGLRWSRARLELEGNYWIPRPSAPDDQARVRVQLGTVTARGCGQLSRDRIEAPLCGGIAVGGMRGDGRGAPNARVAQGLWLALEAGVGLSWWFAPQWALAGGFVASVPVVHPSFDLAADPPRVLFEPSAVAGRLWLGIEFRLKSP